MAATGAGYIVAGIHRKVNCSIDRYKERKKSVNNRKNISGFNQNGFIQQKYSHSQETQKICSYTLMCNAGRVDLRRRRRLQIILYKHGFDI